MIDRPPTVGNPRPLLKINIVIRTASTAPDVTSPAELAAAIEIKGGLQVGIYDLSREVLLFLF
jgi:hypothetical protein